MRFIEVESDAAVHMSLICSPKAGHAHRRPGNAWSIVRCLGQINGPRLGASWVRFLALCATHCKQHARCFAIQIRFALQGLT